jgi:hypothetical protein
MLRNGYVRFGGRAAETTSRKTGTALLSDPYIHYRLTRPDGTPRADVESLTFLDDHSRCALSITPAAKPRESPVARSLGACFSETEG